MNAGAQPSRQVPGTDLALVCCGGDFPNAVIARLEKEGVRPKIIAIRGIAQLPSHIAPDLVAPLGALGRVLRFLRAHRIRRLAMIGSLARPALRDLRLDMGALVRLPKILELLRGGDNRMLTLLARLFEAEGVVLVSVQTLMPELLAPCGALGTHRVLKDQMDDIFLGQRLLKALSPFDIGQGVVVARGRVLAVEAAEGTNAMLARVATLREQANVRHGDREAVFVKAPKLGQDRRLDLPALGLQTLEHAHKAGIGVVAYEGGGVLMLNPQAMVEFADRHGLALYGFAETGRAAAHCEATP